jgi:D-alanyl-D-alanine carboxypeptidase
MNRAIPRLALVCVAILVAVWGARADAAPRHLASVVVDAGSGAVLHAWNANRVLAPASLTKLMTVYVLLDALASGEIREDVKWPVSSAAAAQPPTRLGLTAGVRVSVATLTRALVVASGNDAAVVVAEGLAGSEAGFVARMNVAARTLGMRRTRFYNASGLPHPRQTTSARDMAVLARALWRRHPERSGVFSERSVRHGGRSHAGHNRFLAAYPGADGMKTGFTCRAGFNLVASARRDGRHLIGVVLGAPRAADRDLAMRRLLDAAFASPEQPAVAADLEVLTNDPAQGGALTAAGRFVARKCIDGDPVGPSGWNIELGVHKTDAAARKEARAFIGARRAALRAARAFTIPRFAGVDLRQAVVTGLTEDTARDACLGYRETGGDCIIFGPDAMQHRLDHAARVKRMRALAGEN